MDNELTLCSSIVISRTLHRDRRCFWLCVTRKTFQKVANKSSNSLDNETPSYRSDNETGRYKWNPIFCNMEVLYQLKSNFICSLLSYFIYENAVWPNDKGITTINLFFFYPLSMLPDQRGKLDLALFHRSCLLLCCYFVKRFIKKGKKCLYLFWYFWVFRSCMDWLMNFWICLLLLFKDKDCFLFLVFWNLTCFQWGLWESC